MYSAFAVANAFIERAKEGRLRGLTPMKLQKLLFFTQAWHLKVVGTPLIDDTFTRRPNGPVLPSIQYQVNAYGEREIGETIRALSGVDDRGAWAVPLLQLHDRDIERLVDAIIVSYGEYSARALSEMTHLPGSAWSQGSALFEVIPNETIRLDPTIE